MSLTDVRLQVVEDLESAGLVVEDHVPERVTPPLVLISTGEPYLEEADSFNNTEFVCHLELFLVAETATNSAATKALDQMIETVILNLGDWTIDSVGAPSMYNANDSVYLGSRVSISNTITLEGEV